MFKEIFFIIDLRNIAIELSIVKKYSYLLYQELCWAIEDPVLNKVPAVEDFGCWRGAIERTRGGQYSVMHLRMGQV